MKKITKIVLLSSIASAAVISIPIITNTTSHIYQKTTHKAGVFYTYSTIQNDSILKNTKKYVVEEFSNFKITSNWMNTTKEQGIITVSGDTLYKINASGKSKAISGPKVGSTKINYAGSSMIQAKDGITYITLKKDSSGLFETGVYKIDLENFSTPILVTKFKGAKNIGPFFEADNKDLYLFVDNKIMKKTAYGFSLITNTLSTENHSDFLDQASIAELDGVIYVGTKYGLFKLDSTNPKMDNNIVSVDSSIIFENSYMKNVNGTLYMTAHYNGKNEKKLFTINKSHKLQVNQSVSQLHNIGEIVYLSDGTFIITNDKGIYETKEKDLNSNKPFFKITDRNWKYSVSIIKTNNNDEVYMSYKESNKDKKTIYKISLKDNPETEIKWHKLDDGKIQIDTKIHQNGSILQYKNNILWHNVDKKSIINVNPGFLEFRWVGDSLNSFMYFNKGGPSGDGSGNTYTPVQIDSFNKQIEPAPDGVRVGDRVSQANIDKRNHYTVDGKPIFKKDELVDGRFVFLDKSPFGIEDDNENPDPRVINSVETESNRKQRYIENTINKSFLTNGNSLNLKFDISIIKSNLLHPSLENLASLSNDNRSQISINITYNEKDKKFKFESKNYRIHFGERTPWPIANTFELNLGEWSGKINRSSGLFGTNISGNHVWAGLYFLMEEKNNHELKFTIAPDRLNTAGEDAVYFKKIKLVTKEKIHYDSKQLAAINANFKARIHDKLNHVFTKEEIWMRDIGTKIIGTPIIGLNRKGLFNLVSKTKIKIGKNTVIDPKDIVTKINNSLADPNNQVLLSKNYEDCELEATTEVLGLDNKLFNIPSGQKLHNGSNTIYVHTKSPATFQDGSKEQKITFSIKDRFFSIIKNSEVEYKNTILIKQSGTLKFTNKLLEITSKKFEVKPGTTINPGDNQVILTSKPDFMFDDKKRFKYIHVFVYKNSTEKIKKELESVKNTFNNKKILNQKYNFVFQIAKEINNATNFQEKARLLNKWFKIDVTIQFGSTEIIDITAKSGESGENSKKDLSGEIYLEITTYSKFTLKLSEINKLQITLVGKTNKVISDNIHKIDTKLFSEYFYNAKICEENQGYRTLEEISKIIVDADSLSLLLDGEIPKLHGSVLSKVDTKLSNKWNGNITINVETTIPIIKEKNLTQFTKTFYGKNYAEISKIPINKINIAKKNDIKHINEYFDKVNKNIFIYNKDELNKFISNIKNIKDVHTLKEWTGIDLNISLKASIINKVKVDLNSNKDILVKTFIQTPRASEQETVITKTFRTNNEITQKSFYLLVIIIPSIIGSIILSIGIILLYLNFI